MAEMKSSVIVTCKNAAHLISASSEASEIEADGSSKSYIMAGAGDLACRREFSKSCYNKWRACRADDEGLGERNNQRDGDRRAS